MLMNNSKTTILSTVYFLTSYHRACLCSGLKSINDALLSNKML